MPNLPGPSVRILTVCEDIVVDAADPERVSLRNLVYSIRSLNDPPYPLRFPQLCVLVQLTECRGPGDVRVEIREADTDDVVFSTQTRQLAFPNAPLAVYGLRFRIQNCRFPAPGLYLVQFRYNDSVLAQLPILLK